MLIRPGCFTLSGFPEGKIALEKHSDDSTILFEKQRLIIDVFLPSGYEVRREGNVFSWSVHQWGGVPQSGPLPLTAQVQDRGTPAPLPTRTTTGYPPATPLPPPGTGHGTAPAPPLTLHIKGNFREVKLSDCKAKFLNCKSNFWDWKMYQYDFVYDKYSLNKTNNVTKKFNLNEESDLSTSK